MSHKRSTMTKKERKENMKNKRATTSEKKETRDRIMTFRNSVRYGPIFVCCSCEQTMFEKGVLKIDETMKSKFLETCGKELFIKIFQEMLHSSECLISININNEESKAYFVCHT